MLQSGKKEIFIVNSFTMGIPEVTIKFPILFENKPVVVVTPEFISSTNFIPSTLIPVTFEITKKDFKVSLSTAGNSIRDTTFKLNWIATDSSCSCL